MSVAACYLRLEVFHCEAPHLISEMTLVYLASGLSCHMYPSGAHNNLTYGLMWLAGMVRWNGDLINFVSTLKNLSKWPRLRIEICSSLWE